MTGAEAPEPGQPEELFPGIRRVLAPNPSPMTHWGTNTWLIGTGEITIVDPGPDDDAHLAALRAACRGARVARILVTHSHRDHSALARRLAAAVDAPVLAFGDSDAGMRPAMAALAAAGTIGGGEGRDPAFRPDATLADRATLPGGITAHHTPGHFGNHMCFALDGLVLTGDHAMGWASTMISPPDGDLSAFYDSCARLSELGPMHALPGHGPVIDDLSGRLEWLVANRRERESAILDAIASGATDITTITARVYADTSPALHAAASRNVLAHLIDLVQRKRLISETGIGPNMTVRPQ